MNNVLGDNLKKFRISRKYTQEQAAQLFSVSLQSVSRWENRVSKSYRYHINPTLTFAQPIQPEG